MKIFRGQPDHEHWRSPFTRAEKARAWAGVGVVVLVMGAMKWRTPDVPPFAGRWSWLYDPVYQAFGRHGISVMMLSIGCLFLIAAVSTWLKEKKNENANNG